VMDDRPPSLLSAVDEDLQTANIDTLLYYIPYTMPHVAPI
jgi:hypothetical protein